MSRRFLAVLSGLLLLSTMALSLYTWRLRARLDRAEFYIQSGGDSVFFICSPVVRALQQRPASSLEGSMIAIARECVGQVSDPELESVSAEFQRKDITAITARIKAKLDDHEFPYKTASKVKSDFLPKSYTN